ncbi:MAG: hypothetical protein JSR46_12240, partial [Verrucomicrobia bacterium]|nr:hypothetical protein [Verrucomicrobiota bacterium]
HKHLSIDALEGTASLQGSTRTLLFDLHSKKEHTATAAQLEVTGEAKDLWNDTGLQPKQANIKLRASIKDFPLDVLQMEEVVAVVGPKMDADMNGDIDQLHNGSFRGTVTTPRIHSAVAFDIQDGKMKLNEPLTAQYELTKEAGEVLLKGINPLLASAARSEKPITLWIDNKDFNITLNPFSLKDMTIKTVKIDPGILTVKNKGFIAPLISLLKIPTKGDEIPIWFTPLYIEVKHGTVTCNRTDALLANAFPIATWGKIDLLHDKIDMVLGISGAALSRAFGITTLTPEYLVQIPVRGTVQSPQFDTGWATTKITGLKLQKNKSNATALIGGLLEVAATAGSKEKKPPAPTTYPFPWQAKTTNDTNDKRP